MATPPDSTDFLTSEEQITALRIARHTLVSFVTTRHHPNEQELKTAGIELTNNLRAALGVFVTLEKGPKKKLRGCIGYIKGRVPLWQGVVENACNAAEDSRFMPVVKGELQDICIEVSVMTPLIVCQSVDEIKVGQHGLIIEKGGRSGLLLPQVATEEGWDRDTFLEHTCKKAGLHGGAWKEPGTVIKRFSAQVFNEGKLGGL